MKQSYWRLTKKKKSGDTSLIVELSPDGVVYIWPEKAAALFSDLALELDQDLDALLADGDFL